MPIYLFLPLAQGNWVSGERSGEGEEVWTGGVKTSSSWSYEGQYYKDKRHGMGTMKAGDGTTYVGSWQNDLFHGYGEIAYADGTQYSGNFVEGQYSGHGSLRLPSGSKYIGGFFSGLRNGYGEWSGAEGVSWKGYFENGKRVGDGEYTNAGITVHTKSTKCSPLKRPSTVPGVPRQLFSAAPSSTSFSSFSASVRPGTAASHGAHSEAM